MKFIVVLFLVIFLSSCGRKGDPIPPPEERVENHYEQLSI